MILAACIPAGACAAEAPARTVRCATRAAVRCPVVALSPRQRAVLAAIRASLDTRGYPPTMRELGAELGIASTNGVSDHLRALARKGVLQFDRARARGIRLTGVAS